MFKKFLTALGVCVLVCFSFYYTESAVNIAIKNDPIMKEIIKVSKDYEKEAVDAILVNNNIIPGISGEVVDIDRSYESMKRYGEFNSSLLVFKEVIPSVNVTNNYDKYITSGNQNNMSVSLVFKVVNTNYIKDIIEVLEDKEVKAVFFLHESIFEDNDEILRLIFLSGNSIELYSDDYTSLSIGKNNRILSAINMKKLNYCYTEYENSKVLDICSKEKLHTIIPSVITGASPYMDVKKGVNNGSIIMLNNNASVVGELKAIINYIVQKGKKIELLEDLLAE